jgi:acid phosphatase type 7
MHWRGLVCNSADGFRRTQRLRGVINRSMGTVRQGALLAAMMVAAISCSPGSRAMTAPGSFDSSSAVLVGAGDIAFCDRPVPGAELTSRLLDEISGAVFTSGDNVYEHGTLEEYRTCYERTWGRHRWRTRPVPGNHEYATANASGYFEYFGDLAGPAGLGYYAYDLGDWRVFALNSNVPASPGSVQYEWVRQELETNRRRCTVAIWHYPVFSSGHDTNIPVMKPLWALLYANGAEVVIAGHAHSYERLAPQDENGTRDDERGIRSFVVGTGGAYLTSLVQQAPNSEVFQNHTLGVLKLTSRPDSYEWRFVPVSGGTFNDSGSGICH